MYTTISTLDNTDMAILLYNTVKCLCMGPEDSCQFSHINPFSALEGVVGYYVDINPFSALEGVVGNYVDISLSVKLATQTPDQNPFFPQLL